MISQADDGREAVALARRLRPGVRLFDIRMPRFGGVEATRVLAGPDVHELFCRRPHPHVRPDLLIQAVRAAAEGHALIAPRITTRLLARFAENPSSSSHTQPFAPLTGWEEEDLVTVARGRMIAEIGEIADELNISLSTVKFHLVRLMNKIGARNRVENALLSFTTQRVGPDVHSCSSAARRNPLH